MLIPMRIATVCSSAYELNTITIAGVLLVHSWLRNTTRADQRDTSLVSSLSFGAQKVSMMPGAVCAPTNRSASLLSTAVTKLVQT